MLDINGVINSLNSWWSLAYILAFGILGFLGFYTKVKNAELIKDLWGIREREKYKKQLQKMLDSNLLTESEESIVIYDLVKLEYEDLLNIRGESLQILKSLNSYENVTNAVWLYKRCKRDLKFNTETMEIESVKLIDSKMVKEARKKEIIGVSTLILIVELSYGALVYSLDFIKFMSSYLSVQIVLGIVALLLMLLIDWLGFKIFIFLLKDRFLIQFTEQTLKVSRS